MSYRAGFLGLIGLPNAGKSTVLNALVDEKLSIVTPKPQTTRRRVLGILPADKSQIIIVDAPGVVKATKGLNAFLQKEAEDVIASSDVLCAVLNLDEDNKDQLDQIISMVSASSKPWMALLTKVDLVDKIHRSERLKKELREKFPKVPVMEFSMTWEGDRALFRKQLQDMVIPMLPENPGPLYDPELFTPHTVREMVAELIREKCFEELHQEVPYSLAIRILKFDETDPTLPKISAEIVLSKESHKAIVIGKGGEQIKRIGMKARKEIEKLVDAKVFLKLEVVVKPEWFENARMMKEFGYVSNQD